MPVDFLPRALSNPGRYTEIAHQLLGIGKSFNIAYPATDRYGGGHTDSRNRHEPFRLWVFMSNFP